MAARTYAELKTQLLSLINMTGSTEAEGLIDAYLYEVMLFIARKVPGLPALYGRATATWVGDTEQTLGIVADFGVSDFRSPRVLFVKHSASQRGEGPAYTYRELEAYYAAKYTIISRGHNSTLSTRHYNTEPDYVWTIDYTSVDTGLVRINYVNDGDEVIMYYTKSVPAYNEANRPPIPADFDQLLLTGAHVLWQEHLKEPERIISYDNYLESNLEQGIDDLKLHLQSLRPRTQIHASPRPGRRTYR